jgi:hypothetical protein
LGAVRPSLEQQFITIGVGLLTWAFGVMLSWWQKVGQAKIAAELARLKMGAPPAPNLGPALPKVLVAFLTIGLATLVLAGASPASAQIKKLIQLPDPLHLAQQPAASPAAALGAINFDQISQQIQKVAKEVVDKGIADLTAASQDAQNRTDKISKPCWDAQVAFLQLLPVEWQTPPAEIGPALTIQIGRDLGNAINGSADGSLKVACAALLGDTLSIVNNVMAVVGIKAGLAAVGIP